MSGFRLLIVVTLASAAVAVGCTSMGKLGGGKPPRDVDFDTEIRPILEGVCLQCHNSDTARDFADLNLETRELAHTTGRSAPVIKPGDPKGSLLYQVLSLGINHPVSMPPSPDKLRKEQIGAVSDWIALGAKWPDGEAGRLKMPE